MVVILALMGLCVVCCFFDDLHTMLTTGGLSGFLWDGPSKPALLFLGFWRGTNQSDGKGNTPIFFMHFGTRLKFPRAHDGKFHLRYEGALTKYHVRQEAIRESKWPTLA